MGNVDLAQRISQYRELAGLSQADLASKVGMDRTALAKIENGTRKVSALELSDLAQALRVRLDWFFSPPPEAIAAYRESAPNQTRQSVDGWIERLSREVSFVRGLRGKDWPSLHRESALARGQGFDPEDAARRVRARVGNTDDPIRSMSELAEQLGVLMFSIDLGVDSPDGASAPAGETGIAIVNGKRDVGRRRLTAAHELGHLLSGDSYEVDWRLDGAEHGWEADLDKFGRALLLPANALKRVWARSDDEELDERAEAIRTASHWQVDMSTLARRLHLLGLVDNAGADRIRRCRPVRADFVELDLVKRTDLDAPSLPAAYEKAVFQLYRGDEISVSRATDLLLDSYSEADLPPLPALPDSAIWSLV
jgi:transcriptional regulator with XRE-family HTH domain/Zn-dependent peptidase ImmA (M78 family)